MPRIYHPVLQRELDVSETAAELLTTKPRIPWVRGALPTATPDQPSPEGDTTPSPEEE